MSARPHTATPLVSVVMPTYNGERFLRLAIESILSQTFQGFELIVIDDGSNDGTPGILSEFKDNRIVILKNERNLGIAGATNRGLAAARSQYVALQDHDDISLPHRLQTEVEFLEAHPEIAIIGSAATLIDDDSTAYADFPLPCDEIDIKWRLLFAGDPFHYTSIMARRSALLDIGGYGEDPSFQFSEAYDPLSRLAMRYHIANLPEPLVLWRRHADATSIRNVQQQQRSGEAISFRNICVLADWQDGGLADAARDRRYHDYLGFKAFLFTPAGKFPDLPPAQVVSGLEFLCQVQENFYRMHGFSRTVVARHRRPLNWIWGKHAVALAVRAPWDWRSCSRMFGLGIQCLRRAAWATLINGVAGSSSQTGEPCTGIGASLGPVLYRNAEPSAWTQGQ
jgi:glycosyltransferase involved in cell wall biosynthesis